MSRSTSVWTRWRPRFPRVSGDEPEADVVGFAVVVFSPRERG